MADASSEIHIRLLIINPNTSEHMTDALKPLVENLGFKEVGPLSLTTPSAPVAKKLIVVPFQLSYTFFTCPKPGIASINSPADAAASADHCLPHLIPLIPHPYAFLAACSSQHPLVPLLKS